MNITTIDNLSDKLDEDLVWRKKELIDIKTDLEITRGESERKTKLRCGIPLIYAHWEGFVKNSLSYYLEYVSKQKVPFNELTKNFLGLTLKKEIDLFNKSGQTRNSIHTATVNKVLLLYSDVPSSIPYKNQIDTKSNLNSELFKDLMSLVGVDYSIFETSFNMIDEQLLNMRNYIAHGQVLKSISLDEEIYLEINNKVLLMLENLKELLFEYALEEKYKQVNDN